MLADFCVASCSLLLTVLATYCGNAIWWKKANLIMMVAMRHLLVE
jgi:hypothetical protein